MVSSFVNRLTAGVSLLALGLAAPVSAQAQTTTREGVYQSEAENLYTLEDGDAVDFGTATTAVAPGAAAAAEAMVSCGTAGQCDDPGSVWQSAVNAGGVASNRLVNRGRQAVEAAAQASGADASATAGVIGVRQQAVGAAASNGIDNIGLLAVEARADALATTGFANAQASVAQGVFQVATATGTGGAASSFLTNTGGLGVRAAATADGAGDATALGHVELGVVQAASATDGPADAEFDNSGNLSVTAPANAVSQRTARATGSIDFAIGQVAVSPEQASASLTNGGTVEILTSAFAGAPNLTGDSASAFASALLGGVFQSAIARSSFAGTETTADGAIVRRTGDQPTGTAALSLVNSGFLHITAVAGATADDFAQARASMNGVSQVAEGQTADVTFENTGVLGLTAAVDAQAGTFALAAAFNSGIEQTASAMGSSATVTNQPDGGFSQSSSRRPIGTASAALSNSGAISVTSVSHALATGGEAGDPTEPGAGLGTGAVAGAFVIGVVRQLAQGAEASVTLDNSGTIGGLGQAIATGLDSGAAQVNTIGINQRAFSTGVASSLQVGPDGSILASSFAFLNVGPASVSLHNSGSLDVTAEARASADSYARVDATATGVWQLARGASASLTLDNSGEIDVRAAGDVWGSTAFAFVRGGGVIQQPAAGTQLATAHVTNSGSLSVIAVGLAVATQGAGGIAIAVGASQVAGGGEEARIGFENSGSLTVLAGGQANGGTSAGQGALAIGVQQRPVAGRMETSLDNSGEISVTASAAASADAGGATATALALGYNVDAAEIQANFENSGVLSVTAEASALAASGAAAAFAVGVTMNAVIGSGTTAVGGAMGGSLLNSGEIDVAARAVGPNASATASGIFLGSASNSATVTNTGALEVTAVTDGGAAEAYGIRVVGEVGGAPADASLSIVNAGSIFAAVSTDGGSTFGWGVAIDVSAAPNPAEIRLLGGGDIYGHIDISADDAITVSGGVTSFDGMINPGGELEGALTIASTGTLFLRDSSRDPDTGDGPTRVHVDSFTTSGTLAYELPSGDGPADAAAAYPQVFANTANLDGVLRILPNRGDNGLWADSYAFQDIIDANVLNGTFDQVSVAGAGVLIRANLAYDSDSNVDLTITRTPFGQLGQETPNQAAVGAGIEGVYDTSLEGPFADLLATFFGLDEAAYYAGLEQLTGAQYAGYLHGLRNQGFAVNRLVSEQIECAFIVQGVDRCGEQLDGARVWIVGSLVSQETDGDLNAPGYEADGHTAGVGADYSRGPLTFGGFALHRGLDLDFDRQNGRMSADGLQLGAYGAYDNGRAYGRAIVSHAWLVGESARNIAIGGIGGVTGAEPELGVWSAHAEAGVRFSLGEAQLTPFVAIDHASLDVDGFSETGVPGANLRAPDQAESQTSLMAGLQLSAAWGAITPEARVAYRHDFGDGAFGFDAAFADAPAGSDFTVASADYNRSGVVAAFSLAAGGDRVRGRIGYQGRFSGDATDHGLYGSLTIQFGGD